LGEALNTDKSMSVPLCEPPDEVSAITNSDSNALKQEMKVRIPSGGGVEYTDKSMSVPLCEPPDED
jgi:hypothetical protein